MIPMRKYEYVIIRNDKEIGINEYGFDYLINLENVLDEIREYIEKDYSFAKRHDIPLMSRAEQLAGKLFEILDKVKQ